MSATMRQHSWLDAPPTALMICRHCGLAARLNDKPTFPCPDWGALGGLNKQVLIDKLNGLLGDLDFAMSRGEYHCTQAIRLKSVEVGIQALISDLEQGK